MRRAGALLAFGLWAPGGALADGAVLEAFDSCIAEAVARFEMRLGRQDGADLRARFATVRRDEIAYCGTLGVVACDGNAMPLACQGALAGAQEALRADILASLPPPEALQGGDAVWSDGLYPRLWAVARGTSAGPDCAGADDAYVAWCETRQASLKLSEAVMLWQAARVLGAAEGAVAAGWADAAPPPVPVPRPDRDG